MKKDQQLTIRIDEKTRFIIDFATLISGQSATNFVVRSMQASASNNDQYHINQTTWEDIWDPFWQIREIRMLLLDELKGIRTIEADKLRSFIKYHWMYFSNDEQFTDLMKENVLVLWPHIKPLAHKWDTNKHITPNVVVKTMTEILEESGLSVVGRHKVKITA